MRTFAVLNMKGGVGKTTTAIKMKNNVIDAEWYPAKEWARDPAKYSSHCARVRKAKECVKTANVQRLFAAAVALWVAVITAALIVAVK